jgi:hypothetical protein
MQLFYNPNISKLQTFAFDKEANILLKYFVKKIPIFTCNQRTWFYLKLKLQRPIASVL